MDSFEFRFRTDVSQAFFVLSPTELIAQFNGNKDALWPYDDCEIDSIGFGGSQGPDPYEEIGVFGHLLKEYDIHDDEWNAMGWLFMMIIKEYFLRKGVSINVREFSWAVWGEGDG